MRDRDGKSRPAATERSRQYAGSVTASVGGIKLSIDRDVVCGPVAR
ncbi:MAG TPA: hypothetical protein VF838_10230 [Trebonia sp.]